MDSDQVQTYRPAKLPNTRLAARNKRQALPLKQSRLSSELEKLKAVSKRTFSSGNRMAVRTLLGAIFNLVSRWEAEDCLEEGLYRLLDSLKAPLRAHCLGPDILKTSLLIDVNQRDGMLTGGG